MKKILAFVICLSFVSAPAYSEIVDEFANKTLDRNLKFTVPAKVNITDTFAENSLDKNIKLKPYTYKPITDSFAEQNKNNNNANKYTAKIISYDEVLPKITNKTSSRKVIIIDNDSMTSVPVKIKQYFTTRAKGQEGDYLEFETTKDVIINNKKYPTGSTVKARIETLSFNKPMGVPSDLVIGKFSLDGIPLGGEIEKTGANRALWVYPCVCGTIWFFGIGLLFTPIRGGHAKISTGETFTLYAQD